MKIEYKDFRFFKDILELLFNSLGEQEILEFVKDFVS